MPSPPQIDIDALLEPIAGPNPAGKSVPFPVREKLDLMRKEVLPEHFAKDDPLRPSEAVRADWATIQRMCVDTLTSTSKDLLLAARLLEALVKSRNAAGLRDGLTLLRRMVDECWGRILPAIEEDDDVEVRAAAFNWLDDPDRGARFPNSVRAITLLVDGEKKIDWQTWRQAQSGKAPELAAAFEKAVIAAPRDACKLNVEDLEAAWNEFQKLSALLGEKMGDSAPGLIALRESIEQTRVLAAQILERKGPDPDAPVVAPAAEEEADNVPEEAAGAPASAAAPRAPATRAQVYQQIAAAANLLRQLEPHSPIPYLLQYAVELGALPFPELMKVLVRNPEVLDSMNRVLGIKDPSKPA